VLTEIDITPGADLARSATAKTALGQGFFLVRHTISPGLLDDAYGLLGEFFARSPEEKLACRSPGSNGQSGYTAPMVETAERSTRPDWKELFHWGAPLPDGHPLARRFPARYPVPVWPDHLVPGIGAALRALHAAMLEFQLDVVDAIGRALGAEPAFFRDMLEEGPVVNRATWYPPMADAPSAGHLWAVEHQDFDLVTALPRATTPGLEVLFDDGWKPVTPDEGYAVINGGMVLERLTNGAIPAALHRVVSPPGQHEGRLSIVQFCHPTPWTVLTPLTLPGAMPKFSTLTAGDLFDRTMFRINRWDDAPRPAGAVAK
jgi:isopenicillin N synthase-like dioxygenase